MARVRSPSYPNYPLEDAIENARKVFDSDRRNPVDREVAARHLGYSGLNGAADKAIATMLHYGLFEKVAKGEVRVSQDAVDILHPDTDDQKHKALERCAFSPKLFQVLRERFPDGTPSNEALKSYLVRENFNDRAIGPITTSYSKTCALLEQSGASKKSVPPSEIDGESSLQDEVTEVQKMQTQTDITTAKTPPQIVSSELNRIDAEIKGDKVMVTALLDLDGLDKLERKIAALKAFMTE